MDAYQVICLVLFICLLILVAYRLIKYFMPKKRYCVSKRVWKYGSLISSFYDNLEEAIEEVKRELLEDKPLPYIILLKIKLKKKMTARVQLVRGSIDPFYSHLNMFYSGRWKVVKKI